MNRVPEPLSPPVARCAIYTRTATTQRHAESDTSLAAQRKTAKAFIASQRHRGWLCLPDRYDDEARSGLTLDRPALKRLLADIQDGKIDHLIVYRLDRLTRSWTDMTTLIAVCKKYGTALSSVTESLDNCPVLGLQVMR